MSEHVPGSSSTDPPPLGITPRLIDKLAGNAAFGRMRGRLGSSCEHLLNELLREAASPTATLEAFDAAYSQLRPFVNLLAQLKRDGEKADYAALMLALIDKRYVLPGETTPLDHCERRTIVMRDAPRTLAFLRWIMLIDNPTSAKSRAECSAMHDGPEILAQLDTLLPETARLARSTKNVSGQDLHSSFAREIGGPSAYRERSTTLALSDRRKSLRYDHNPHVAHTLLRKIYALLYYVDQGEALSTFTRQEQKTLASWQFTIPFMGWGMREHVIGFHPESEHEHWAKLYPALASASVSHGWGAIIIPLMDGLYERDPLIETYALPTTDEVTSLLGGATIRTYYRRPLLVIDQSLMPQDNY